MSSGLYFENGCKLNINGRNFSHLVGSVHSNIRNDRFGEIFDTIDTLDQPLLLIGTGEEPVDQKRVSIVYDYATKYGNFKKIAALTCSLNSDWKIKHFFSPRWMTPLNYGVNFTDEDLSNKTVLFHCLNKAPRVHRIKTFLELRNRRIEKLGLVSFLEDRDYTGKKFDIKEYIPEYPIEIDTKIQRDLYFKHTKTHPENPIYSVIKNSLFGLITETAYHSSWDPDVWKEFFISEKTFSCFSLFQIPIIIGQPGSVKWLKEHGFDMFDDLIDNSYDLELDPDKRYIKAIDQLEKFRSSNIRTLFNNNRDRFIYNRENLIKIHNMFSKKLQSEVLGWIEHT